jgi:hypothetical protein
MQAAVVQVETLSLAQAALVAVVLVQILHHKMQLLELLTQAAVVVVLAVAHLLESQALAVAA